MSSLLKLGIALLSVLPLIRFGGRDTAIDCAMMIALFLALKGFYKGVKLTNRILLTLVGLLPFTAIYGLLNDFKVYVAIAVYLGMYISVSREEAEKSLDFVLLTAFILSIYGILQFLGFESIYIANFVNPESLDVPNGQVASTLGHPTLFGAYVAMLIPLAIKRKKWVYVGFMITSVIVSRSDMAIGAMVCSLLSIPFFVDSKRFIIGCIITFMASLVLLCGFNQIKPYLGDSGRFEEWSLISKVANEGIKISNGKTEIYKKYNLFGYGAGSFKKLYPKYTGHRFNEAHNEYLQCYFEFGVLITACFVLFLFLNLLIGKDQYTRASILCISLNAIGCFVWQIGIIQYISIFILVLNKIEKDKEYGKIRHKEVF